jgi:hypothetical protein
LEGVIFALHASAYRHVVEVHLSTLNGLHVIPAEERDFGNVFQTTIRGRWELPGVFHCITGERLILEADGRARWGRNDWQGLKPYRWGIDQ